MQSGIERELTGDLPFPSTLIGANDMAVSSDAEQKFDRVKTQLKARLGTEVYSSWFGRMKVADASKGIIRISVPTAFLRSWINGHYLDLISELWKQEDPDLLKIEIVVRTATRQGRSQAEPEVAPTRAKMTRQTQTALAAGTVSPGRAERAPAPRPGTPVESEFRHNVLGSPLDPRYTFGSFIEGPSNRVAFAAAKAVAESQSSAVRFNPLFLHATVGLGKTHLLQAIAAESLKQNPKSRVVYLTAEYFMWRFATAIRDNTALTLNGGVALEMSAPDFTMRLGMLKLRLATARVDDASLNISEEILNHVARTVTGSGRELEGAFNQLLFRQSFEPQITIDRIDEILGHIYRTGEPKRVRIEDIQRIVARHYNVSKTELLSNRRTRTIVKPRQVAMYLSKVMTPRSLPEIGRRFGGRDHTTVLHAVRKIEDLSGNDNTLAQELELLRRLINDQA